MDYDRLYVDLFCGNTDITYYRVRKYISTVELKSREVKKVFWYSSLSRYTPTKAKSGQRDKHFFKTFCWNFRAKIPKPLYHLQFCAYVGHVKGVAMYTNRCHSVAFTFKNRK